MVREHHCSGGLNRLFRRARQGRRGGGVALYAWERFDLTALTVRDDVVESLWVKIRRMENKEDVIAGVYHQSPSQEDSTDEVFYRQLGEISGLAALVLTGDFNFPHISWEYHTVTAGTSTAGKFLKFVEDNFFAQALSEPARKGALLDSLFVNKEGLVGDVTVGGCLGHSDHKEVEFKLFGVMRKKVSIIATVDIKRANLKLHRELLRSVPWEATFEDLGLHESWSVLKNHLLKAQEQAMPLC